MTLALYSNISSFWLWQPSILIHKIFVFSNAYRCTLSSSFFLILKQLLVLISIFLRIDLITILIKIFEFCFTKKNWLKLDTSQVEILSKVLLSEKSVDLFWLHIYLNNSFDRNFLTSGKNWNILIKFFSSLFMGKQFKRNATKTPVQFYIFMENCQSFFDIWLNFQGNLFFELKFFSIKIK